MLTTSSVKPSPLPTAVNVYFAGKFPSAASKLVSFSVSCESSSGEKSPRSAWTFISKPRPGSGPSFTVKGLFDCCVFGEGIAWPFPAFSISEAFSKTSSSLSSGRSPPERSMNAESMALSPMASLPSCALPSPAAAAQRVVAPICSGGHAGQTPRRAATRPGCAPGSCRSSNIATTRCAGGRASSRAAAMATGVLLAPRTQSKP
mmetsp:Transcript_9038/g.26299  ORF Transcript_9038/g.26299 Transcript_9038/m.26299 type:complete len:204 (+) Transcript_9038:2147-2758(+)